MKWPEFRALTRADLFRYAGRASFRDHLVQVFLAPGYRYTWWMRFCAFLSTSKLGRLLFPLAWLINRRQQIRFGIGISYKTQVGPGLYIGHEGGIFVSEHAVMAKTATCPTRLPLASVAVANGQVFPPLVIMCTSVPVRKYLGRSSLVTTLLLGPMQWLLGTYLKMLWWSESRPE